MRISSRWRRIKRELEKSKHLYLLFALPLIYIIVFKYGAMLWLVIAFKRFRATQGIWGSDWVGLRYFLQFIKDPYFWQLLRNTFVLNLYNLFLYFPIPIILGIMINEVKSKAFKRTIQTISYMPYFVSTVAVCGLVTSFLSSDGLLNTALTALTGAEKQYLMDAGSFRSIYVGTEIWQYCGWGSIIYLAALTGVDPQLYEAARIDGASRFKQVLFISIPSIASIISIQLLLTIGRMLTVGYEKILLLYNGSTYETADVMATYIYRQSLLRADYSYGAAISLFQAVISLVLVVAANSTAKKIGTTSLW